ncbi:ribbon-helix-helix domain-containing protein [Candidatus Amarobacter glycogenicus]|uniref:ribbon-helix-helix domain-containing protein n=1 Tax=Candidatus Amarobacter glycogenicus TaxID=3140699 RepID=UPI002A1618CD|nr:ribbon-helix-helix protein, CopG family [Dehalococcoidia bacterium]MBK9612576.1 ribbon-helix-helix protein, CopG family [Dehalococcoidia bacterium]
MSIAPHLSSGPLRRITISVPGDLVAVLDSQVAAGAATSRTELINQAIVQELRRLRRAGIDAQILAAATDPVFADSDNELAMEFESSDRESWELLGDLDRGRTR